MKTVFSNSEVAHVWAQQNQEHGRNSGDSFCFEGDTIYSYGRHFPIARFVSDNVVLFTNRTYSPTTAKHMRDVSVALSDDIKIIHCKYPNTTWEHSSNLKDYRAKFDAIAVKLAKSRTDNTKGFRLRCLWAIEKDFKNYVDLFEITHVEPLPVIENVEQAKIAMAETIALEKEKEKEQKRLDKIANVEKLSEWKSNRKRFAVYGLDKVYMKRVDDDIVTTMGATFPVASAVKLWAVIRNCIKTGSKYVPQKRFDIGYYSLTSVSENGDVKAGCHYLHYEQCKELAQTLELAID